ncbi:TRAP transporter fused permease subunit [uncultured Roseovarius sp.]|uniref:TRAP transporter fused permease subunit n=1 Tax=uncultured Roseovarius sp. TaxID=293344 RepID=UPI002621E629|nr:TRAP transporter fused permease subunit [uncultured Roseovarius sp.]
MSDKSLQQEAVEEALKVERSDYFGAWPKTFITVAALWSLYQLWIASPIPYAIGWGIFVDLPARGVHLAFGLFLCFLLFPAKFEEKRDGKAWFSLVLAIVAGLSALYVYFGYDGIVLRAGILLNLDFLGFSIPIEVIISAIGMLLLLEATRRGVGLPLVIVCGVFMIYSLFGPYMPEIISHRGVSIARMVGYNWLTSEAIFGIPIAVSLSYVFLFVLFGAFMDTAGAGKFFLDMSFAAVGKYRGGPAKAAILASGLTGMISGSSIANTVTTGAFTIPVMKKTGFPGDKAGAIEVSASINGQLMPPIMGASAFIIAEFIGISYYDVIVHAMIPAFIAYLSLFYISHLESLKMGLVGLPKSDLPAMRKTFKEGAYFLIPIGMLVYLLLVKRWSPGSAVFWSIMMMAGIIMLQQMMLARQHGLSVLKGLRSGGIIVFYSLVAGAKSMTAVTAAVGAAGIIVGIVSSTGLNNAMLGIVEALSQGNIYILLFLVAVVSIILGMGLPTTANYIVVASLMAGVMVELGNASGLVLPLIAVHLYVFYFGLMADATPPVCLAAFAASAISGADPMKTGIQSFKYAIRTAILPVVFIFNPELLLVGVESVWHGIMVFVVALMAIFAFSSLTLQWMFVRLKLVEVLLLVFVVIGLFRPDFVLDRFSPAFNDVPLAQVAANETSVEAGQKVRLYVTRETEYGDRFKLFTATVPEASKDVLAAVGLSLDTEDDGRTSVSDIAFNGPAEQLGISWGDYVTSVGLEQSGRMPKEIIYIFGILAYAAVVVMQRRRLRKIEQTDLVEA